MLRALYRQIARLLDKLNGSHTGSSPGRAIEEAEAHRRDVESRGGTGGW
jgi:hypothetical protein